MFNAEYPMVRWLEANGYDVSYTTGVDTDRRGAELLEHKVFLSVGHDEYWSGGQRANVEAARGAGVNLAFFSGNEVFWKTRWETSIDGSNTPNRTLVSYKETHADAKIDPVAACGPAPGATRASARRPTAAGRRTRSPARSSRSTAVRVRPRQVPVRRRQHAPLAQHLVSPALPAGSDGNPGPETWATSGTRTSTTASRPPGLVRLSSTTADGPQARWTTAPPTAPAPPTHSLTLYRQPNERRAMVFGAGTVQWSWGLDATARSRQRAGGRAHAAGHRQPAGRHGRAARHASSRARARCALGRLHAAGIDIRTRAGWPMSAGVPSGVSGRATDAGGGVGGVEVR